MSKPEQDTQSTQETPPVETEEIAKVEGEEPADEPQETEETEKESEEGGEDLPDWARAKMTKANAEAANYRTRLREAEQKLEGAKTLDEVETILSEWKAERETKEKADADEARALLIENIALKYDLPAKLQGRLVGATREELEADAKELAADFVQNDVEIFLEGGLSPKNRDTENLSPRELAQRHGGRRRYS